MGPVRKAQLAAVGVTTVGDLLLHLPTGYQDRRRVTAVEDLPPEGGTFLLEGHLVGVRGRRARRRGLHIVEGSLEDATGSLSVVWFNQRWFAHQLDENLRVLLYGQVGTSRRGGLQIVNPEVMQPRGENEHVGGLMPLYSALGPISGRAIRPIIHSALSSLEVLEDPLPEYLRTEGGLLGLAEALRVVHEPPANSSSKAVSEVEQKRSPAHLRLAFDELLAFSCGLVLRRERLQKSRGVACRVDDGLRRRAADMLDFSLTGAQRRVLKDIVEDLSAGSPMARLVQGDVGSGKTVVAALAMLIAIENGVQAALMAPTELLAAQHLTTLTELFSTALWKPRLLTGTLTAAEKKDVLSGLATGRLPLVVGTHALVQDGVDFANLGLVVIDEQHRFGTAQRQRLVSKGRQPHVLVMTATPIPRSLALTMYGDLDLSVIDELPPGRRPVRTEIRDGSSRTRVYEFVRQEVAQGGRAFVVFPLIEVNDAFDARALESHVDELKRALPGVGVGVLHGRLESGLQEEVYRRFRSGELQVLAATTVIEVGIDVPEASVMVIESAERFGLSQLHQLRGRVGRGDRPSWCVLVVGEDAGEMSLQRLEVFAKTADGFAIAEADLAMRGPGELTGLRQWGHLHFRFADLLAHHDIVEQTRKMARDISAGGCMEDVMRGLSRYHPFARDLMVT